VNSLPLRRFLSLVLVGGAAAPTGAVLGTGLLILLPEWLRFLKVLYLEVYGAAVILIMVFMPDGISGYLMALSRNLCQERPVDPRRVAPLPSLTRATAQEDGSIILSVRGLSKHFGGLKAVADPFGVGTGSQSPRGFLGGGQIGAGQNIWPLVFGNRN
jgi:branched-chain amino acid transport system permease protein